MRYVLTLKAEEDLKDIYDFSYGKFGQRTADHYFDRLLDRLEQIADFPELGVQRSELSTKIRSILAESHLIFYEIKQDYVLIVRVLHHSRSLEKYL